MGRAICMMGSGENAGKCHAFLAEAGYDVEQAYTMATFIEAAGRDVYDTALIDLDLLDIDAVRFVRQFGREQPLAKIVACGTGADLRAVLRCLREGVAEYVAKPLDDTELREAIRRVGVQRTYEHEREMLLNESMENFRLQQVYRGVADMLVDAEERGIEGVIARSVAEILGAHGAIVWCRAPGHTDQFRIEDVHGAVQPLEHPPLFVFEDHPMAPDLLAGEVIADVPLSNGEDAIVGEAVSDGALLVPLVEDGTLTSVIRLLEKSQGVYTDQDHHIARMVGRYAASAIRRARGKGADGGAPGMRGTLQAEQFDQHARREIEKARRYSRRLSFACIAFDNFTFLQSGIGEAGADEIRRELQTAIMEELREGECVTAVRDHHLFVLMPETGYLAAGNAVRAGIERFRAGRLCTQVEEHVPLSLTAAIATHPTHGADYPALLYLCMRKIEEQQHCPLRRLRLDEVDFHPLIDVLIGGTAPGGFVVPLEDARGTCRRFSSPDRYFDQLQTEIAGEFLALEPYPAVCVLGAADVGCTRVFVDAVAERPHLASRLLVCAAAMNGERHPDHIPVQIIDDAFMQRHRFLIVMSELYAYGVVLRQDGAGLSGFHSCSEVMIGILLRKFLGTYKIQGIGRG